jgi:glycosyltransferase involved in cell wall biosynthesis
MQSKLVSVLMTCYNGGQFLEDSLNSLLSQTYANWELIFVNNCSTDKSEQIIKNIKDERIKYFKTDEILNLGSVRNLALSKGNGDFFCFLDTDDIWDEKKLYSQLDAFEANKNIEILGCSYFKFSEKKKINHPYNFESNNYDLTNVIKSYIRQWPLSSWLTLMVKSELIKSFKFDKNLHICTDFDMIISLINASNFYYLANDLAGYRIHDNNESNKKDFKELDELFYIYKKFKKKIDNMNNSKINIFFDKINLKKKINYFLNNKHDSNDIKLKFFYHLLLYKILNFLPKRILCSIKEKK